MELRFLYVLAVRPAQGAENARLRMKQLMTGVARPRRISFIDRASSITGWHWYPRCAYAAIGLAALGTGNFNAGSDTCRHTARHHVGFPWLSAVS